jgi:hypothetical protein
VERLRLRLLQHNGLCAIRYVALSARGLPTPPRFKHSGTDGELTTTILCQTSAGGSLNSRLVGSSCMD